MTFIFTMENTILNKCDDAFISLNLREIKIELAEYFLVKLFLVPQISYIDNIGRRISVLPFLPFRTPRYNPGRLIMDDLQYAANDPIEDQSSVD
jgi:hypothetical protein